MTQYRVYVFDVRGHIEGPPRMLECDNDSEAILRARELMGRQPIEIWLNATRIAHLEPENKAASVGDL
jgi:hypothetical protein